MIIECDYCVVYLGFVYIVYVWLFVGYWIEIFNMFNFWDFIVFFNSKKVFLERCYFKVVFGKLYICYLGLFVFDGIVMFNVFECRFIVGIFSSI